MFGDISLLLHKISAYLSLTKPTLQLLVVVTGAAGLAAEGSLLSQPVRFALVLVCLALSAGSAKALNQYLERDVDAVMERTRLRRPLPLRLIHPSEALIFAAVLGILSVGLFGLLFNPLAAMLSAGTILFYSLFYTQYLKPRTPYSIVIGGVAGGMGPVIAWAAASGSTSPAPWLMLAVVFFWTPPHFWSLAMLHAGDYRRVGYPMLPDVKGAKAAWKAINRYAWLTVWSSLTLTVAGAGWLYLAAAMMLGMAFLYRIHRVRSRGGDAEARRVFLFSIIYLLALFATMIADRIIAA